MIIIQTDEPNDLSYVDNTDLYPTYPLSFIRVQQANCHRLRYQLIISPLVLALRVEAQLNIPELINESWGFAHAKSAPQPQHPRVTI